MIAWGGKKVQGIFKGLLPGEYDIRMGLSCFAEVVYLS
jgi:hypothetical protein